MTEAINKILHTPAYIGDLVAMWKQRQNAVIVALCHAVTDTKLQEIGSLQFNNAFGNIRGIVPHPVKQGWPNVKADLAKVTHTGIRFIAFSQNLSFQLWNGSAPRSSGI